MNLNLLLEKAKAGRLEDAELAYVGERLELELQKENPQELYTLVHILGKADFKVDGGITYAMKPRRSGKYRPLLEKLLYYPDDTDVSSIAILALCSYWNETERYIEQVKIFIKGVDWDEDHDVFFSAVSIAGEYLRKTPNEELYQFLALALKKEQAKDSESPEVEALKESLSRTQGTSWQEILSKENDL